MRILNFRNWQFEVDKELTEQTYAAVATGGAEECSCENCKKYVTYRENVFPSEIRGLFNDLGVDYRKEVEVITWDPLPDNLQHISGWFHFKGRIIRGKICRVPLPNGGYTFDLTKMTDNFSIGFSEGNDLTYFDDETGLIQVEFSATIPSRYK